MMTRSEFLLVLLLPMLLATNARGAACCGGGNPRSFISLKRLQTYELGVSASFRDVYGRFNDYGELDATSQNRTLGLTFGAGARLTLDLQAFATLPFVYQSNRFGPRTAGERGIGDVSVGLQYLVLESLFADEWYPTISLTGGLKAPTGRPERGRALETVPATGNGLWEPFVGLGLEKHFGSVILTVRGGYSLRLRRGDLDTGDLLDLTESVAYVFDPRFSLAAGSTQAWFLSDRLRGNELADTAGRVATLFVAPTYFLNRFWSVSGSMDFAIPQDRFGVSQQAAQTFTLTTKYGFY